MKTINYEKYDEIVHIETLPNGLEVHVVEKNEYVKSYVSLSVKYGSLDLYQSKDTKSLTGIAHYLEHMLFNTDDGDVSEKFMELGANVNAFTSLNQTCYYFQASENITRLTNELLTFVFNPSFTEQLVEKERSIIIEELKMYLDSPSTRIFNKTNENLFVSHPCRYDIGGSISDVEKITKEDLKRIYNMYYVPSNMIFCYIGPIDKDIIFETVKEYFKDSTYVSVPKYYPEVEESISEVYSILEENRQVSKNIVAFKILSPIEKNRLRLTLNIYLSLAISETSHFYEEMSNKNIINNNFFYNILSLDEVTVVYVSANSKNSEEFYKNIIETLNNYVPSKEDFDKFRIKFFGSTMALLNSLDNLMFEYVSALLDGTDIFDLTDLVNEIDYKEILNVKSLFNNYTKVTMK